ncbi:MAG TPA: Uma2 family endonuclease [Nocardiopsis listeri]|uniref:Uma2 family endonuclease n=1 Tax=Nocardiopsis listeri TaxID=53440 RepID=UPI001D77AE18|nr:Uma2 family endonuclease [Nocardiopsis listeri]HJE57629.1 Uma2 family endonuclease [Nocardiopsis listeri]
MSVMTIGKTDPEPAPLTVEDLRRIPDDGRRYELVDGRLDASPAPVSFHTLATARLTAHLSNCAPSGLLIMDGPGVILNAERTRYRVPDLAVIRSEDFQMPYTTTPPLLAVEVVSPESVFRDHYTKRQEYAAFGIPSYWVLTPDPDKPSIIELRLKDGEYTEVAPVFGEDVLDTEQPFPVRVVPQWLLRLDGDWRQHVGGPKEAEDAKTAQETEKPESGL